jgi:hypothetical protein
VLEPHRGDDPVAVLIEPLRTPEQESRVVVPRDPELPLDSSCAMNSIPCRMRGNTGSGSGSSPSSIVP